MSARPDPDADRVPPLIERLMRPLAFDHPVRAIDLVETHISWVLLTGDYAYKIKKPLKLPFLDFSSLQLRLTACQDELRLNRRFAPDLYLEVVPITGSAEEPRVGGASAPFEYAVKMRQFPPERQLDHLLTAGKLSPEDLAEFGRALSKLHAALPTAPGSTDFGDPPQVHAPLRDSLRDLLQGVPDETVQRELHRISEWLDRQYQALVPILVSRKQAGRIHECHGDLHLANLVKTDRGIVPFDCIEFSAGLRWIDVISDTAFLVMDLVQRGHTDLAYTFLNAYLEASGDYEGVRVLHYYAVYRALVRAKIAMIRQTGSSIEQRTHHADECSSYVRQALHWARESASGMVLMHGLAGSGKTRVSGDVAARLPAVRVRSDVERKRLYRMPQQARSGSQPGAGLYNAAAKQDVYSRLLAIVHDILGGGETAIVDATFLSFDERNRFDLLARQLGLPLAILDCVAPLAELESRIAGRLRQGNDASEADAAVLRYQLAHHSPLREAEHDRTLTVDTTKPPSPHLWCEQLRTLLERQRTLQEDG